MSSSAVEGFGGRSILPDGVTRCPVCGESVAVVEVGRASWSAAAKLALGFRCSCGGEWVAVYALAEVRRVAVQGSLF